MKMRKIVQASSLLIGLVSLACTSTALATTTSPRPMLSQAQQAPAEADRVTVPLSDPSRPALLTVGLVTGNITVRGTNRKDMLVITRSEGEGRSRRYDGDSTG